jgi:sulfate transport system ATP-binding protein
MEMADRVAVLRSGRIEQVDTPARLYAEPASIFVYEFLGESVRFSGTVTAGCMRLDALPDVEILTRCAPGPAVALIRPHEIGLLPGPGPAHADSQQSLAPLRRTRISVLDQTFDVLTQEGVWAPEVGQNCRLDLTRARAYPVQSGFAHPAEAPLPRARSVMQSA